MIAAEPRNPSPVLDPPDQGDSPENGPDTASGRPRAGQTGVVYLIHFETPFKHAQHYLGWSPTRRSLAARIEHHLRGTGANLLKHVNAAGIEWWCVRVWDDVTRDEERRLKNLGGRSRRRRCPVCRGDMTTEEASAHHAAVARGRRT